MTDRISNTKLREIHSALDCALGDTDPYIDEDMTDDDIRDQEPLFWAAKTIAEHLKQADYIDRLETALHDIARQKLSAEHEEGGDFEEGYDAIVRVARAALRPDGGGK